MDLSAAAICAGVVLSIWLGIEGFGLYLTYRLGWIRVWFEGNIALACVSTPAFQVIVDAWNLNVQIPGLGFAGACVAIAAVLALVVEGILQCVQNVMESPSRLILQFKLVLEAAERERRPSDLVGTMNIDENRLRAILLCITEVERHVNTSADSP